MKRIPFLLMCFLSLSCGRDNEAHKTVPIIGSETPIVRLDINNTTMHFIIDTGSDISFINENTYQSGHYLFTILDSSILNFNTLNNTNTVIEGTIVTTTLDETLCTNFTVYDIEHIVDNVFITTGILIDGIIGNDSLREWDAIIDFERQEFTYTHNNKIDYD